jgi:iron(II)-dependent oxidoreductase
MAAKMRELFDRTQLARALQDARHYTLSMYAHLDEQSLRFPYLRTVNPPAWELAHLAWFQEHWCLRWHDGALRAPSLLADADPMLNSALIAHRARWELPALDAFTVRSYLAQTLELTLRRLESDPLLDPYFPILALYHEDMHAEAFLMALQSLALPGPGRVHAAVRASAEPLGLRAVAFSGGTFEMGSPDGPDFVFDNERRAHCVEVAPFVLAATTVTQGEFKAFVEANGYRERRWWTEEGWQWRERAARSAPRYWRRDGGLWRQRRFDRWLPLQDDVAMVHVNAYEAEAYCAFAGARLPSEAEWEYAARAGLGREQDRYPWGDSMRGDGAANLDCHYGSPLASAALPAGDSRLGLRQMLGNVWEWTCTQFLPYPGFAPGPYKEYSQPWFGDHRVLRGGCFATRSRLVHSRWRNFYTPDRDDVFAGIRLAYDDAGHAAKAGCAVADTAA